MFSYFDVAPQQWNTKPTKHTIFCSRIFCHINHISCRFHKMPRFTIHTYALEGGIFLVWLEHLGFDAIQVSFPFCFLLKCWQVPSLQCSVLQTDKICPFTGGIPMFYDLLILYVQIIVNLWIFYVVKYSSRLKYAMLSDMVTKLTNMLAALQVVLLGALSTK